MRTDVSENDIDDGGVYTILHVLEDDFYPECTDDADGLLSAPPIRSSQGMKLLDVDIEVWCTLPRCYRMIFYVRKEMFVQCYNEKDAGMLFLAQGTGGSESFNALYRKTVVEMDVKISRVSNKLHQHLRENTRETH